MPLGKIAFGCFVLGVLVMVPFESPITLTLGVLLLFASIITGVFAIASPAFLSGDRDEPDQR
jgi:hypothetical protein